MSEPTIPCEICGDETRFLGTRLCDGCWELDRRVRGARPDVLAKVLARNGVAPDPLPTTAREKE